jgi:hypothetical protein
MSPEALGEARHDIVRIVAPTQSVLVHTSSSTVFGFEILLGFFDASPFTLIQQMT